MEEKAKTRLVFDAVTVLKGVEMDLRGCIEYNVR
jgi:hypothetical protein